MDPLFVGDIGGSWRVGRSSSVNWFSWYACFDKGGTRLERDDGNL